MRRSFVQVPQTKPPRKLGFSLIEVMVGLAVFSLAMISIMGVVSMSQFIGGSARARIEALQDAREIMEVLKAQTYHNDTMYVDKPDTLSVETSTIYNIASEFNSPNWDYVVTYDHDGNSGTAEVEVLRYSRQSEGNSGQYTVSEVFGYSGELKQVVLTINYDSFLGTDTLELVMEKSRALN